MFRIVNVIISRVVETISSYDSFFPVCMYIVPWKTRPHFWKNFKQRPSNNENKSFQSFMTGRLQSACLPFVPFIQMGFRES